jgi:hypothetical protein
MRTGKVFERIYAQTRGGSKHGKECPMALFQIDNLGRSNVAPEIQVKENYHAYVAEAVATRSTLA